MPSTFDPDLGIAARLSQMLHHRGASLTRGDPAAAMIAPASTFHVPDRPDAAYTYGRTGHPGWSDVETQIGALEQAEVIAFPSGLAALAAVAYSQLKPGDRVVLPGDGYYGFRTFMAAWMAHLGIDIVHCPTADMEAADYTGAALVFLETPSNPGLEVCDIRAVANRVHAAGARLVVDNTTLTPLLQRPLDLGADIVAMSDTKAMAGHSDVVFGHVATRDEATVEQVRSWRSLSGAIPGVFAAWMVHRGLETLEVRLSRMSANARMLAERMGERGLIVRHPSLNANAADLTDQMDDFGPLVCVELESRDVAERFISGCAAFYQTTSFGGVHSSAERRARWGDEVAEGFVRISCGIEPTEALWSAVSASLDQAGR